ncbi:MAG: KpsF/GutQ family sugar-phosphate isomerase [Bacteroidetes bacterium]|nr:KpsF/GutQ family sugar-phosphate isomerase [Bacteroidota bacterium]
MASLDELDFARACELMLACSGRVVVSGMGKSGHIARKIASTLTSTGTPAIFLHPAEASHGDIGLLQRGDILLMLSKSGESDELAPVLSAANERQVPIIAITSNARSQLAKAARDGGGATLFAIVKEEACPHDLAPTSSTTAQLVIGDAIAVALLEARNFTSDDFARLHPGGALGRRLTMTVRDLMSSGADIPIVTRETPLPAVMLEISGKRLGAACVVDRTNSLVGIVTDGDLRRFFQRQELVDVRTVTAGDLMSQTPKTTSADTLAIEALHHMEDPSPKVMQLPVLDEHGHVVGLIHLHEIVRVGIA